MQEVGSRERLVHTRWEVRLHHLERVLRSTARTGTCFRGNCILFVALLSAILLACDSIRNHDEKSAQMLFQSDDGGYDGHGIHGKTRKEAIPALITFLCSSMDSVAAGDILAPGLTCQDLLFSG